MDITDKTVSHESLGRQRSKDCDALSSRSVSDTESDAEAKFAKRLQRQPSKISAEVPPEDLMPVWLMNCAPDPPEFDTTTEDVISEFIQCQDMCELEKICSRKRIIDDSELTSFAKKYPEIADNLKLASQHVADFLSYRRVCKDRSLRRNENAMKSKTLTLHAVHEGHESDSDDLEHATPGAGEVAGALKEGDQKVVTSNQQQNAVPQLPVDALQAQFQQQHQSQDAPRQSVLASPRLCRAGGLIVGNMDARAGSKSGATTPVGAKKLDSLKGLSFGKHSSPPSRFNSKEPS